MSERACPGCGKTFRSGSRAILRREGRWSAVIVCGACFKGSLSIVVPTKAPPAPKASGVDAARVIKDAIAMLTARARMTRRFPSADAENHAEAIARAEGRIAGLEEACETLKRLHDQARGVTP